ncbi:MAG: hypothetical protein QNJ55_08175 [Xenococcus sp. MO_188.B8]|nr:hypothetical protein [Xenococcus sp. MO_188.B8]
MKRSNPRRKAIVKNLSLLSAISTIVSFTAASSTLAQEILRNITLDGQINPNPMMIDGMSGGSIQAIEVVHIKETTTGYCNGLVDQQPNHILTLNNFFEFLKIEVESSTDTTILVQGPGGVWCNDDYNNDDPALEGQWQQGKYKIWVGSYDETPNSYRIRITGDNP